LDPLIKCQLLYQLSYAPGRAFFRTHRTRSLAGGPATAPQAVDAGRVL
jgi:hypothetical protein